MLRNKLTVAALLGAVAVLPVAGNAQVIPSINTLIADTDEEVSALISSIAGNDATIDGSIDITVDGSAGGSLAGDFSTTTNDILDAAGSASFASSAANTGASEATEGALAIDWFEDNSVITEGAFAGEIGATTVDLGDVSATALGAVNNGTVDLTETAGMIDSSSSAATSSTDSAADYALAAGTGISVEQIAANTGEIIGTASINFSGNGSIGEVGTTAAGAINTSTVTAAITGAVFGDGTN
ncbi:hypothetical protein [Pseudooceanicola sp. 200-1SW]|uniref:hypothetical protein n=1 Tax=Pseudooceanicola sp. 200-1SW TaxID=3425949 RepID=UPI003D7F4047